MFDNMKFGMCLVQKIKNPLVENNQTVPLDSFSEVLFDSHCWQ